MKRQKILINLIILLVAIFFAYQVFSYIKIEDDKEKSSEIYRQLDRNSLKKDNKDLFVDFSYLKNINPQVIAWIYSGDGRISYPIVKPKDDNFTYLKTAFNGTKNIFGSIFMDYRNDSFDDDFIMIYGHMTKNETMFGSLNTFKNKPYYKDFDFYREDGKLRTEAVMAGIISGDNYINPKDYKNFDKRKEFFDFIRKNAVFDTGYELKESDEIVNLVTCSYERKNSRLVVVTVKNNM